MKFNFFFVEKISTNRKMQGGNVKYTKWSRWGCREASRTWLHVLVCMHRATPPPPPPPPATTPASRTRRDNVAARSHGRQSASALHKDRHGFRKSLTNVCLCFNQIEIKKSKSSVHHFVSVYIGKPNTNYFVIRLCCILTYITTIIPNSVPGGPIYVST